MFRSVHVTLLWIMLAWLETKIKLLQKKSLLYGVDKYTDEENKNIFLRKKNKKKKKKNKKKIKKLWKIKYNDVTDL